MKEASRDVHEIGLVAVADAVLLCVAVAAST